MSSNNRPDDNLLVVTETLPPVDGHPAAISTSPSPLLQQLELACQTGSLPEVERILPQITPLPDLENISPTAGVALSGCLRAAVTHQHRDIVRTLLKSGFLPNRLSGSSINAALHGDDTITLLVFLESGWDVNERGQDMIMRPLLQHAINRPSIRSFLLANGADPNLENERGTTALETAVQSSSSTETVKELLDSGGDPLRDDSLIIAAALGKLDVAELLLERGANVNASMKELAHPWGQRTRITALDAAAGRNQFHMVEWLKSRGATARNNV
ncbi:hypothetical protein AJ79_05727 [Helicocarpus griseus UAMH5409]|uniref:Uncharacterized protein n=1 Tax=Helicocarpus griseus UAMH5409 TaxID=1447875 RepID=A0A2B7XKQ5_9EURO|nr:hypothetical protein AJ79_05727 [Helicocarpus griseus UAMH5409]